MCAHARGTQDRGLAQAINKKNGVFTRADEKLVQTLATQAGVMLHHSHLLITMQKQVGSALPSLSLSVSISLPLLSVSLSHSLSLPPSLPPSLLPSVLRSTSLRCCYSSTLSTYHLLFCSLPPCSLPSHLHRNQALCHLLWTSYSSTSLSSPPPPPPLSPSFLVSLAQ